MPAAPATLRLRVAETSSCRYELSGLLGQGAFGMVYEAQLHGPAGFSRVVALKVLKASYASQPEFVARMRVEAQTLARLHHPGFVRVDRVVELDLGPAVVMERVDGVDLRRALQAAGRVPLGVALDIVAAVAGALHVALTQPDAHGVPLGLMHRDLKPNNIFVTRHGEVKLGDLSVVCDDEDTPSGVSFATPEYAAPERYDGRETPASDVYALGAVLYELATGERFGLASPVREHHEARWREALDSAARQLSRLGPSGEGVVDLLRYSLAWLPEVRPPADAIETVARSLRAGMRDEGLRAWAARVISPLVVPLPLPLDDEPVGDEASEDTVTDMVVPVQADELGLAT